MTPTCSAGARLGALLTAVLFAIACQDTLIPNHQPGTPALVQTGPQPAIAGLGTLGTGDSTPGSDLQQFNFDVKADLTGRLFYRDWQPPFNGASITVDQDTATKITVFQDGWSACADGTHGAQFAGTGRLDTGGYEFFIVRACDDGASGSGADRFELTDGDTTATGYDRDSLLSSGEVVKTVTSSGGTAGSLKIKTSTSGDSLPPRYTFSVSGPAGSATDTIGVNSSRTFAGITTGDYTVTLASVPSNCTVNAPNPRVVTVRTGETDSTTFAVSCTGAAAGTGNLTITTATTGAGAPAGYTFSVSGPAGSTTDTIGANASRTFAGIATGDYTVQLSTVPANCTVTGGTSRTATVASGGTTTVAYSLSCVALSGDLTVSTSTSGSSLPSGYTITVDGGQGRSLGTNGSVTYTNLSAGSHSVALTGVPNNCTVSGTNPRSVSVPSGGTANTTFSVSCVTPNQPPSVNAGSDETVLLGVLYSLSWSFSDPNNDGPWSYTINWGDGSSTSGSTSSQGSRSTGHTYLLIGQYAIRVTVTDSHGGSGSDTKVLTVVAPLPGLP